MQKTLWLDKFLFWDTLIVTLLVFADWLLGEKKRAAMREKVGEWWLHLEEVSFSGLVAEDADLVRRALQRFFGKTYGFRCIILTFFLSFSFITISYMWFLLYLSDLTFVVIISDFVAIVKDLAPHMFIVIKHWGLPNAFFDWLSLALTMFFLKLMARNAKPLFLCVLILFDIIGAIVFATIPFYIGVAFLPQPGGRAGLMFLTQLAIVGSIVAITSAIPSILHLMLSLVFLLSKLFRPLIQKPISLILIRFHESRQGVLTQLAAGFGAVAKLIQMGAKYFFNT
jgi:hypothetical protein